ncbi:hypothetical protein [Cupriavidus necator]|uniref:hypothetical protein n=1 Tax=Cupriavidus necator TaxID=106590 RepID=UPI00149072AC|nr:hypothetical protein [Cupriavidus necator]
MGKSSVAAEALAACRAALAQPNRNSQVQDWQLCGKRVVLVPWINGTFRAVTMRVW